VTEELGGMATSSLLAARILGPAGIPQSLIGTLAHEGPMAFMALHSELDRRMPMSSLLWHLLFWGLTSNYTILPDGHGSATFKAMLSDLGLVDLVTMARQDSGHLRRFAQIFDSTQRMASEIETFADVEEALHHGYVAFGAGGFFGEKRRVMGPEFSLAAKITKTLRRSRRGTRHAHLIAGYAGKLGDCSSNDAGSWAEHQLITGTPAKFIVSPEANRDRIFRTMLSQAAKGDKWFDRKSVAGSRATPGDSAGAEHLVTREDAMSLVEQLRAIATSVALSAKSCKEMQARLIWLTDRIKTAAQALP